VGNDTVPGLAPRGAGRVRPETSATAMWDGIPTSSAVFALAADVVILVALVWAHWPSAEVVGV
jgi:hypothetical protein